MNAGPAGRENGRAERRPRAGRDRPQAPGPSPGARRTAPWPRARPRCVLARAETHPRQPGQLRGGGPVDVDPLARLQRAGQSAGCCRGGRAATSAAAPPSSSTCARWLAGRPTPPADTLTGEAQSEQQSRARRSAATWEHGRRRGGSERQRKAARAHRAQRALGLTALSAIRAAPAPRPRHPRSAGSAPLTLSIVSSGVCHGRGSRSRPRRWRGCRPSAARGDRRSGCAWAWR